ncbi:MAG: hypothetical protein GX817_00430 [Elusimicrobia bacterium]|nr:hypothetical protein [Elusimicrobiota bacterium]
MIVVNLLILLIFLFFLVLFLKKKPWIDRRSQDGILKDRYIEASGLPSDIALEALQRRVEALEDKYPMRKDIWYIEKALFEIERDRGR